MTGQRIFIEGGADGGGDAGIRSGEEMTPAPGTPGTGGLSVGDDHALKTVDIFTQQADHLRNAASP